MPRIREGGTRGIRQPMGNPSLPETGPVVVDLNAAPPEKTTLVYGSSAHQLPPSQLLPSHTIPVDPPPQHTQPVVEAAIQSDDELDDPERALRRTRERAKSRREQALEAENQQLRAYGQQQANEAAVAKHGVVQSNLDTVASALTTAESELATAKQSFAKAWQSGDGMGVADAQAAIADAQYRINTLRAGKDELEQQVKVTPQPAPPPATAVDANVELVLSRMPNLRPDEKDWIRAHPDSIAQHNVQRLRVAFDDSQRKGLQRGTAEYFEFLNDRLDYTDDGGGNDPEDDVDPEPPRRQGRPTAAPTSQPRVAAPVRNTGMGQGALPPGKIMLTQAQREIARASGVSELEYARGVQRLMTEKAAGMYGSQPTK